MIIHQPDLTGTKLTRGHKLSIFQKHHLSLSNSLLQEGIPPVGIGTKLRIVIQEEFYSRCFFQNRNLICQCHQVFDAVLLV